MSFFRHLNFPIEPGRRFKFKAYSTGELHYDPLQYTGDYLHRDPDGDHDLDKKYRGYVLPDNHGVVRFPLRWKRGTATVTETLVIKAPLSDEFIAHCKKYDAYIELSDTLPPKIIFEQGYGNPAVEVPLEYEDI